jgi:hypothetical protein
LRVISGTHHLISVPFEPPGRKPRLNHPSVRVNACAVPECFDSSGNGVRRETNPLGIIEIAGRMDDSANYSPLFARKRMLAHLLVDDAETLRFDFLPGLDQSGPVSSAFWGKLQYHFIFTSYFRKNKCRKKKSPKNVLDPV